MPYTDFVQCSHYDLYTGGDQLNGLICFANKYILKYMKVTEDHRGKPTQQTRNMGTERVITKKSIKKESESNKSEVNMEHQE